MSYQIPEDISVLDNDGLNEALSAVADEFAPIAKKSDDDLTDEEVARMEELSNFAKSVQEAQGQRAEQASARADKLAGLRATMAKDEDKDKEGEAPADEAPADEAPAEEAPADEVPVAVDIAPVVDLPADELPAEEEMPVEVIAPMDEDEDKKEKAAVTASAGKSTIAAAARQAPKVETKAAEPTYSLVAAADVPGIATGTKFKGLEDAGKAISERLKGLPTNARNLRVRNGALVFRNESQKNRQSNVREDLQLLLEAGSEKNLEGNSLVAAGGWGAPSDQLLDFCALESADGLIDMAEVTVDRGGLKYTKGPSFADVLASDEGFWDMSEATAEAGVELKTSLRPEVPPFVEKRLDAVGTMMEAGLLLRAGWPELVERYASMALLAHEIKMHLKKIAGIQAYTGAAKAVPNGFGNAIDILNVIDVVATGERQRNSLAPNATLEALLPMWVHPVIRADLANRNGVDFLSITDAQITGYFTARNIRPQFLSHYQNLAIDATAGIAIEYPDTIEIIMYPAGTFVAGVADVITLDTVYDSTNLKKNDYVHLFVEQGLAVTNPCNDGRRFSLPVDITGRTGAADIKNELFKTAVTP